MPLSTRELAALHGLLVLSAPERATVLAELNRFTSGDQTLKKSITEASERAVSLGPIAGGCPCCGR